MISVLRSDEKYYLQNQDVELETQKTHASLI